MSLSTGQVPLMSADWCTNNALKVGAVARDDWLIWDMSKSRCVSLAMKPFQTGFLGLEFQTLGNGIGRDGLLHVV